MTHAPHTRTDLTRWNRAGLTRFDYVDGNAAVWLEELRLAALGLYMRGGPDDARSADDWRDLWLDDSDPVRRALRTPEQWRALAAKVDWDRIAPVIPDTTESRGDRAARLQDQYTDGPTPDHAWEILRAMARASHVLTGHLQAYANEGYLRTATQWDNLRRLAALVNYQPTPPASASTLVALTLKPDAGLSEVKAGLPMKYAPTDGGATLIFETASDILAHPDLNAARPRHWQRNRTNVTLGSSSLKWLLPEKSSLSTGDIVVATDGTQGFAAIIDAVTRHPDETAQIDIADSSSVSPLAIGDLEVLTEVEAVRAGLARPKANVLDLVLVDGGALSVGGLVRVLADGVSEIVEIAAVEGAKISLQTDLALEGEVKVSPLIELLADKEGEFQLGVPDVEGLYFADGGAPSFVGVADAELAFKLGDTANPAGVKIDGQAAEGRRAFFELADQDPLVAKVDEISRITADLGDAGHKVVSFAGKPPKSMVTDSWLVARSADGASLIPLRVVKVTTRTGSYELTFDRPLTLAPEETEFHGPLKTPIRAQGHDRNPERLLPGSSRVITLDGVSAEARGVLRPGRAIILSDEMAPGQSDVSASIIKIEQESPLRLRIEPDADVSHLVTGSTLIRLNVLTATHGEQKGPKTLGSGDGEFGAQVFTVNVGEISHVPSSKAISGVVPDMTVTVDGEAWDYRDYADLSAEGALAWSTTLGEDGLLRIHFRRRLPTGTNNVGLLRHRVGVGSRGNAVPPLGFEKPMKKHPKVGEIYQPFATAGGADREAVESVRRNAPSRLVANGRAVSLKDFERLTAGHASILRAHAEERSVASAIREVVITVVPSAGAPLTPGLTSNLTELINAHAIPGVVPTFRKFGSVLLDIGATVRADLVSYDQADILAAAQDALLAAFSLETREFGQAVYKAEVLAALETVTGVLTAQVDDFGTVAPVTGINEAPRHTASNDGTMAAVYLTPVQVATLDPRGAHLRITVKGAGE
ncbi:hypothetical protein [Shimia ponticola]|uniref:hypothetical protein n=1 Tax=Shimia ponticola TaxID=2582893 RepID=UPI0011BF75C7|nr:hypothetical protein [Shimia ponticola]